mmetsp:Transcript_31252/g.44378  ORF Transcript_31252/g.44378 Transcript_31252/m.44378 type:complete len:406 (+) Transcript_31252:86-1303(+)
MGEGGTTYGGTPTLRCFNAAKHWYSGWYESHKKIIDPKHWYGSLIAFTDKKLAPKNSLVVARFGDYFLQYNRKETFNRETGEYGDAVAVVKADTSKALGGFSELVAFVDDNNATARIKSYAGGKDLVINLCERRTGKYDSAHISIHLDDGFHHSKCEDRSIVFGYDNVFTACWDAGFQGSVNSYRDCEKMCFERKDCKSFSYHPQRGDKICHFCTTTKPRREKWNPGSCFENNDPSQPCTLWSPAPTQDLSACWDVGFYFGVPSYSDCRKICVDNRKCNSFSYHIQEDRGRCHLCSNVKPYTEIWRPGTCPHGADRTKPCSLWNTVPIAGQTACSDRGFKDGVPDFQTCRNECKVKDGCISFSYHAHLRCHFCSKKLPERDTLLPNDCPGMEQNSGDVCSWWSKY